MGVWSSLKSPVWMITPTGVSMASETASATEWVTSNVVVAGRTAFPGRTGTPPFPVAKRALQEFQDARPESLSGDFTVLTDDYNPLDLWSLEGHEEWRREALAWLPWEVVISE